MVVMGKVTIEEAKKLMSVYEAAEYDTFGEEASPVF
jgi:hypothetical protein